MREKLGSIFALSHLIVKKYQQKIIQNVQSIGILLMMEKNISMVLLLFARTYLLTS